jgi:hypothetical protein
MQWGQWPIGLGQLAAWVAMLPGSGGGGDMPWYTMQAVTASATANNRALVACDMGSAVDDVTITAPEPVDGEPNYFGVSYASYTATAKVVVINSHDGNELKRLYVERNAVWFGYEPSIGWVVLTAVQHDISFAARFGALANYVFGEASGTNQLADNSGNARHMTREATYPQNRRSSGVRADSLSASFGRAFTRADAAFPLLGAASWEILARGNYSVGVSGDLITCGGSGVGAGQNINWSVNLYNGTAGSGTWSFRQMSGTNNQWRQANYSSELYVAFEWQHVVITRAPVANGNQNLSFYLNGQLMPAIVGGVAVQNFVPATDNPPAVPTLKVLGGGPNLDLQLFAIYGAELNAAQANYLARLRLGGRR